jgi:hypothetical protein
MFSLASPTECKFNASHDLSFTRSNIRWPDEYVTPNFFLGEIITCFHCESEVSTEEESKCNRPNLVEKHMPIYIKD